MERNDIATQLQIEQGLISHIVEGLREAMDWKADDSGLSRKLSTIRFVTESLHRHLERLMAIHEYDGYMSFIDARLQPAVESLKREHETLRAGLNRIVSRLDRLSPQDAERLTQECEELAFWLRGYESHCDKESQLLQESFLRDEGGEG